MVNRISKIVTSPTGVLLGRSDVARILDVEEWIVANLADPRLPCGIRPTGNGPRSNGQRGRYTVSDIYKVALASRLDNAGFSTKIVIAIVNEVFPPGTDAKRVAVDERGKQARDARWLVVDWSGILSVVKGTPPPEWTKRRSRRGTWIYLVPSSTISDWLDIGLLRATFVMPFDDLMMWATERIIGIKLPLGNDDPKQNLTGAHEVVISNTKRPRKK